VTDGDDSYGEGNLSLGRSIVPLEIPLDRTVVAQAQAHLREQSPEHRARWHRQIEVVLHRFARRQGYRRRAVHVSAGRTQIWWMPPKSPGLPPTDIQFLRSPALHAFSGYQSLSRAISDQAGLAQLVIASLLVRRDYRLRDFASIQEARGIFDGMAPSLVRVAHRYVREPEHIRALEGLLTASRAEAQAVKTQADTGRAEMEAIRAQATARQVSASRAGAEASRAQAAARNAPIVERLEALQAAKTPRRHWNKLTRQAIGKTFPDKSETALEKAIARVMQERFPRERRRTRASC
jgi:hypothetical protein